MIELIIDVTGLGRISELRFDGYLDAVMSSVDAISRSAFETEYGDTPFINATGRYHDAVQFVRESKTYFRVTASIDYSSYLEYGHQSFGGYFIMTRTADRIASEISTNLQNLANTYFK